MSSSGGRTPETMIERHYFRYPNCKERLPVTFPVKFCRNSGYNMEKVEEKRNVCGIRRIVRLMRFARKWKRISRNNSGKASIISPATACKRQPTKSPEADVPNGYMGVYAGRGELRRFIIPTTYLSDPLFKVLLEKAEEEFGFDHCGGLTIPCEIETFKYLLKCMETHQRDQLGGGAAAANLSLSTAANAA